MPLPTYTALDKLDNHELGHRVLDAHRHRDDEHHRRRLTPAEAAILLAHHVARKSEQKVGAHAKGLAQWIIDHHRQQEPTE